MNKQYHADLDKYIDSELPDNIVHHGVVTDNPNAILSEKEILADVYKLLGER